MSSFISQPYYLYRHYFIAQIKALPSYTHWLCKAV
jgi:hypothetical protein